MVASIDSVFTALSNPTRRELLRLLREEGRQPVQQLATHFAMRRPSISEHLKMLREVGLVGEQKKGRHRYYYLEASPLMQVYEWLLPYEQFWTERFARLEMLLGEEGRE